MLLLCRTPVQEIFTEDNNMGLITTKYQASSSAHTYLRQEQSENGTDGRVWSDMEENIYHITDDFKIGKLKKEETVETFTTVLSSGIASSSHISMALNDDASKAYVLFKKTDGFIYLKILDLDYFSFSSVTPMGTEGIPLKVIIGSKTSPYIWYLKEGSDNSRYLFKTNLDGSSSSGINVGKSDSFALSSSLIAFTFDWGYNSPNDFDYIRVKKIIIDSNDDLSLADTGFYNFTGPHDSYHLIMKDGFVYGNYVYALLESGTNVRAIRVDIATVENWRVSNLTSSGGILPNIGQFFTNGTYLFFYENSSEERKIFHRMSFDFGNKQYLGNIAIPGDELDLSFTAPIPLKIVGGSYVCGCDPAGFDLSLKGPTGGL